MTTPLHASDLHGLSRLGVDGVRGVTDLVEDVHHAVLRVPGIRAVAPDSRTGGITGFVYRSIHGVTGLVGSGLDLAFTRVVPRLVSGLEPPRPSPTREQFLAILNGVLGDHLAATDNPLAIRSSMRRVGRPVALDPESLAEAWPEASNRLLVTAHGLCMHDGYWRLEDKDRSGQESGLPESLAASYGYSTVDFYYNTGRHISDSGRDFAEMLERLVANWPVDVEQLVILGHSMGGLVARSAAHQGLEAGQAWPATLKKIVFLGTPHHGSPVERAGHGIDRVLGVTRYSAPFNRLGKIRSAGITDLRHGNIIETDWATHGRFDHAHDTRSPARLPAHVECFAVAATLDEAPDSARARHFGDGLVPVPSALGQHRDPAFELPIKIHNRFVATETGHLDLLRCPDVARQVHAWLA
ncbi:MAG: permease [Xanthomonadales bacterium]|nr:permease [Xanthomonadales bacterium]